MAAPTHPAPAHSEHPPSPSSDGSGELLDLSLTALRDRLAAGACRATEIADAVVARTHAWEPLIRAWAHFDPDYVHAQARALDHGTDRPRGTLHGVPVAIKDVIDTASQPTENGTPIDRGRVPERDAACVAALREAGAVIAGKAVTAEMAFLHPGPTRNPCDPSRTPGGSSSGSAALVAAGVVPGAVGTQTGGSVLRPASFCGVVGFKPSFGAIPTGGVLVQSPSLDTVGVFARDVAGAAALAEAMFARPSPLLDARPRDGGADGAPPPLFAFARTPWWERADPAMQSGLEGLARALGRRCREIDLPPSFEAAVAMRETVNLAEMARHFAAHAERGDDRLSKTLRDTLARGREVRAHDYLAALEWPAMLREGLHAMLGHCDAILMPAAPGPAPEGLGSTGNSVFNALATFAGTPAITLPLLQAVGPNGPLPMGVQLVGRMGDDTSLIRAAQWLERWARDTTNGVDITEGA